MVYYSLSPNKRFKVNSFHPGEYANILPYVFNPCLFFLHGQTYFRRLHIISHFDISTTEVPDPLSLTVGLCIAYWIPDANFRYSNT